MNISLNCNGIDCSLIPKPKHENHSYQQNNFKYFISTKVFLELLFDIIEILALKLIIFYYTIN